MPHRHDSIVAISSPAGIGRRGILRCSGEDAFAIGDRVFVSTPAISEAPSWRWLEAQTRTGSHPVHLIRFAGPRSYTGEDSLEVHLLSNPILLQAVLEQVVEAGARLAEPGEFTRRAFLNGRLDLTQAEAVGALIAAQSRAQERSAYRILEGGLRHPAEALLDRLIAVAAEVEASIDFVEEEIEFIARDRLETELDDIRDGLVHLARNARQQSARPEAVRVVLIGLPNVGKSSLLNRLAREEAAIVTDEAGTTRDAVSVRIPDEGGLDLLLTDLPGHRETDDPIETLAIERADRHVIQADLRLFVLDATRPLSAAERDLMEEWEPAELLLIANKIDLGNEDPTLPERFETVRVSARTGSGIDVLRKRLRARARHLTDRAPDLFLSARQRRCLDRTVEALDRALEGVRAGVGPELIMVDIQDALDALGDLVGKVATDDILDRIFSTFCIGK